MIQNINPLNKAQNNKIENVTGLVWFMGGSGKFKLPFRPPSTSLSRIQHNEDDYCKFLIIIYQRSGYQGIFNVTQSAIPCPPKWIQACDLNGKRENNRRKTTINVVCNTSATLSES